MYRQRPPIRRAGLRPLNLLVLAGLAACASTPASGDRGATDPPLSDRVELVVLGTTDVHGRLYPYDYYTGRTEDRGLARAATLIDSLRGAHTNVVLIDSGDLLQGNPLDYYFGIAEPAEVHPVVHAMNVVGYDGSAIGNHEFNYGLPRLEAALDGAEFPFLAGNVFVAGTDSLRWPGFTVIEREGVRVGIVGFTTPGVTIWDRANVEGQLEFRDVVDSARRLWPQVEAASDVQIVALHAGLDPGSSYDEAATGVPTENVGALLAEALPGIEAVFLGHTHRDVPSETVNGVLFTQAKNWAAGLAKVTLEVERTADGWSVVDKRATTIPTSIAEPDPAFLEALRPYHEKVVAYVADTIGWVGDGWSTANARLVDTPVIDLIQRVQLDATGADLSAASAFTTEARLGPGPVTVADAAALYIYDNTLKMIEITGRQLREYLEYSAKFFHRTDPYGMVVEAGDDTDVYVDSVPGYNYDIVAGVEYEIDLTRPVGDRIRNLRRGGEAVTDDQTFTMAINNYRQEGGGGFSMIQGAPLLYDRYEEVRQLLIDWIAERDTLRPEDVFEPSWSIVPPSAVDRWRIEAWPPAAEDTTRLTEIADRETGRIEGEARSRPGAWVDHLPRSYPAGGDTVRLAVVTTNDFHGRLEPQTPRWANGDTVGGAAVLAAYVRAVEERYPGATLHLDGGDVMQGTVISNLVGGRSTVEFFNMAGVDAAAIGNHEFDWGLETLLERIDQAEFPWLSANIFVRETGERPEWAKPYAWLEAGGLKIAVIGASTVGTPTSTLPTNVAPFEFPDIAGVVNELAPRLREEGADLVFLAAHAGAVADSAAGHIGEIVEAAERITVPLDLIVAGHTHTAIDTEVNGIPIVEARSYSTAVGIVTLTYVKSEKRVIDHTIDVRTTWAREVTPADGEIAEMVERYRAETADIADRPIATLAHDLPRNRGQETALGDLIADAQRAATGDPIAIVNGGGIRTDLQEGPITFRDVFALQPFQNILIRSELTGEQLRQLLEATVDDRIGQVSGIRFRYDPTLPAGRRVRDAWLEEGDVPVVRDGQAVEPETIYRVTANNFMATGGSGYSVLQAARSAVNTGFVDSEVLAEHMSRLPQPIRYERQGRIERLAPWPNPNGGH